MSSTTPQGQDVYQAAGQDANQDAATHSRYRVPANLSADELAIRYRHSRHVLLPAEAIEPGDMNDLSSLDAPAGLVVSVQPVDYFNMVTIVWESTHPLRTHRTRHRVGALLPVNPHDGVTGARAQGRDRAGQFASRYPTPSGDVS